MAEMRKEHEPLSATRLQALTHTYPRRHARTHSGCLVHTRKRRTHWSHTCRGVAEAERKEGTDGPHTHRRPGLEEEEERPGNLPLRREGAHRREGKRDREETLGGQRMGRQGLARTRWLLQGWELHRPLARGAWGALDWTRGTRASLEQRVLRDSPEGLDLGGWQPKAP